MKSIFFLPFLFLLFSNQRLTSTVLHTKASFYLVDRQSLSIPLWTIAPDYRTQIGQKRTMPLFSGSHPKDSMVPRRPGVWRGSMLLCYLLCLFFSCLFPNIYFASTFTLFSVFLTHELSVLEPII